MRRMRLSALALAFAMLAAACSGNGDEGGTTGTGDGEAAAGAPVTLEVTLTDFKIDPEAMEASAGSAITFSISNQGQAPHTFAVVAGDQTYETAEIQAGGSDTLEVPALDAGEYEILCTVAGHAELGMTGTLTVGGDAAAPADTPTDAAGGGTASHGDMTAEEMAVGHEEGVADFVGQLEKGPLSEPLGNQPMKPRMDGDVKVFDLTVTELEWEVRPGESYPGMAFNGQIPGPLLQVFEGDTVRFEIQNQMTEPFTLHFHGLTVPNDQDGVPYVPQPPIMPGEYWTYEFPIVDTPGMYVYHSHFNSAEQVGKGLYGALNVLPKNGGWASVYGVNPDVEYSLFLGDGPLNYTLNGKSFPATEPIVANEGDDVLIHIANDGAILHPMHLHGFHFEVVAVDGFPLAENQRYMADTLVVAPGSRYDILVKADQQGAWAYHCHILPHAEGPDGMFGMVTALVVV